MTSGMTFCSANLYNFVEKVKHSQKNEAEI